MAHIQKIILPTRPQPDTIVAILLLRMFGKEKFPGMDTARIEIMPTIDLGEEETYWDRGSLLLDIGGGRFDHHNKIPKTTTSELVAQFLDIAGEASIAKLLAYAQRDDFFGRGTVSPDPLDRAFGLSSLIAVLNKEYPQDPNRVIDIILPVLEAHLHEEDRRTKELPEEFAAKKIAGEVEEFEVRQRDKKLKVVMIKSDNPSFAGFLRSANGGKYDVVLQRSEEGFTNILTRPAKHIDLRTLAALVRIEEAERQSVNLPQTSIQELMRTGRHPAIKEWYYDRATNSIQNGGLNPQDVSPTKISWGEFRDILSQGLAEIVA